MTIPVAATNSCLDSTRLETAYSSILRSNLSRPRTGRPFLSS